MISVTSSEHYANEKISRQILKNIMKNKKKQELARNNKFLLFFVEMEELFVLVLFVLRYNQKTKGGII